MRPQYYTHQSERYLACTEIYAAPGAQPVDHFPPGASASVCPRSGPLGSVQEDGLSSPGDSPASANHQPPSPSSLSPATSQYQSVRVSLVHRRDRPPPPLPPAPSSLRSPQSAVVRSSCVVCTAYRACALGAYGAGARASCVPPASCYYRSFLDALNDASS